MLSSHKLPLLHCFCLQAINPARCFSNAMFIIFYLNDLYHFSYSLWVAKQRTIKIVSPSIFNTILACLETSSTLKGNPNFKCFFGGFSLIFSACFMKNFLVSLSILSSCFSEFSEKTIFIESQFVLFL